MRESEKVERGKDRSGASSPKSNSHGYLHNVDQDSISFFITNFPEDCTGENLWEVFARFGRLGDVYIPKKVDKWGRRFGFVKYREVKEVEVLSKSLQDVWVGSFKLRVNKSRFNRNEEKRNNTPNQPVQFGQSERGEGGVQLGRSFKSALVVNIGVREAAEDRVANAEEVLNVEVDALTLKELETSFVGVLAVEVEVRRIKTILYMEGYANISATDMGRNKVLLHSSKPGELEALCKAKTDWLCYYFKEVIPWSPSNFADNRVTWVKVFGIPLHAWGDNLFKAIGGKYGEFLDYDNITASRAKLDVARLKISTSFRGYVDESVKIKVLGVVYTIWVVEEKGVQPTFSSGSIIEENDQSWVGSSNYPAAAMEVGDQFCSGSVDEGKEEVGVDLPSGQDHTHGELLHGDGDMTVAKEGNCHFQFSVSANILEADKGNKFQTCEGPVCCVGGDVEVSGTLSEKVDMDASVLRCNKGLAETYPLGKVDISCGGPEEEQLVYFGEQCRVPFVELDRCKPNTRSSYLPPNFFRRPDLVLGVTEQNVLEFNDSISLVETRRDLFKNSDLEDDPQAPDIIQQLKGKASSQRGRTRKRGGRSKSSNQSIPKFIRLVEVVREGGAKLRWKRTGKQKVAEQFCPEIVAGGSKSTSICSEEEVSRVPNSVEGLNLEVVLPGCTLTPSSGINLLLNDNSDNHDLLRDQQDAEAVKLLQLQKQCGGEDEASY
ncbi:hypothetical protein TSUD_212000 [Trifolium subterraneum]|uniref:RRM domain-containing protein n=1 Tax=Trifolium subterraneum TaxID=3900 RepID=A0A2Z6MKN6_TRISU|nr:hypothetical protein TSUD_212000 [Trifolium subterraneum]